MARVPSRRLRAVSRGSSARTVPTPAMTASTVPRSACTSIRAASRGDPHAGAVGGGGAPVEGGGVLPDHVRPAAAHRRSARRCCRPRPRRRVPRRRPATPAARRVAAPPAATGFGSAHGDDHPGDAGVDQRLAARAGAAGVVAGFQGDHGGAAPGPLAGLGQRDDLGVRPAGVRVEALADDLAVRRRAARSRRPGWGWWCRARARPARRRGASPRRRRRSAIACSCPLARRSARGGRERLTGRRRRIRERHSRPRRRPGRRADAAAAHGPSVPRAVSHPDCLGADEPPPTVGPGFSPGPPGGTSRPGRGLTTVGPWITAGSEFHRVPPARGGYRGSLTRSPGARPPCRRATFTPVSTIHRDGAAAVDRHVRARAGSWPPFSSREATAIASSGSVKRLLGVRERHPDREGDQGGPADVAAPVLQLDVAALARRSGRRGVSAAFSKSTTARRRSAGGPARACRRSRSRRRRRGRGRPAAARRATTARCRLRASARDELVAADEAVPVVDALEPVDVDVADRVVDAAADPVG